MWKDEYREEMTSVGPTGVQMERLRAAMARGGEGRPRRLTKRAAAALAACAALVLTAFAAGPTIAEFLEGYVGPFAPYMAPVEGTMEDQGIRVRVEGSLSDGVLTKLYVSAADLTGDRLDGQTRTHIMVNGAWRSNMVRHSSRQISYDPETKTALYEVECQGLDYTQPVSVKIGSFQPQYYSFNDIHPDLAGLTARPVRSERGPEGEVILAMENPQTFEGLPGLSVSLGIASDGLLHVRSQLAEGYTMRGAIYAMPISGRAEENLQGDDDIFCDLPDGRGMDMGLSLVTAANVAEIADMELYGTYVGPAEAIEGEWKLENVQLETAETRTITVNETYGVLVFESIQVSPLGVTVFYHNTPGDRGMLTRQHACIVHLRDGTDVKPAGPDGWWSGEGPSCAIWTFDAPVDLEQIDFLTIYGREFQLG